MSEIMDWLGFGPSDLRAPLTGREQEMRDLEQALAEVVEYCTAVTAPFSGMIEPQPPVWAQMLMRVNEIAKEGMQ